MKLRIVATSKDIFIFIIFALFLLYVVALGVLNLPQLAAEGTFYGLNPIMAFSSDYILFTLVFYLLALGGLFFSVSSYFFERESGVGFGLSSKNSGGYSNWAKPKEIKEDSNIKRVVASSPKSDYAGIPLISNGRELWVDNGEYHNLVIGATGSGKTVSTILPTVKVLAKKGESIICTDPKGEIFEKTGGLLKKNGYNIILLNFRNPQNGNAWNPLALPYKLYKSGNQDKAIELLDDLALNILYEESSANSDPFWEKTAADYFAGIALAMFEDTTEDKININSINMTATVGEDKCGGSTYIKEYFKFKDPASAAYVNASGTVMAPDETKGGIVSVFKQKVKLFASRENLSEMLSHSDFDLDSIGKEKTAVFIIIQDEKKTYHSLATIFIKQVYETLIDVAQHSPNGKLPCRTNFLLDEFANMPPLKDVTTMITAARSRQIRFTMIIQNFAQLNKVYGKDDAETIKGNCGNIIYLISTELAALEEISKLCGEKKSKKDDKTASTPLVTVSDLQRMKQFDEIVLRMRKNPFKTSFVPDFKIDWGECKSPKIDYPVREKKEVQVFDIRKFVEDKKKKKLEEMMQNMGSQGEGGGAAYNMPPMMQYDNPFMAQTRKAPEISISDVVKKIDQKLAEMEKEEREQKQKANKEETITRNLQPTVNGEFVTDNRDKLNVVKKKPLENNLDDIELLDDTVDVKEENNHVASINKNLISSSDIENKVNGKIADEILDQSDYDENDFDLLTPIENISKKDINVPVENLDSSVNISSYISEDKETNFEQIEQKQNDSKSDSVKQELFEPTPTIKLEDVSEDDKFFDDFFDD